MGRSNTRKQRVVWRLRHREVLKHHLRAIVVRSSLVTLGVGFVLGLVVQGDSVFSRFVRRHTPSVEIQTTSGLANLPLLNAFPKHRFWLWFPGAEYRVRSRMLSQFPAVRQVRLERHLLANRVIARIDSRVPLVRWESHGVDGEGHVFDLVGTPSTVLPQAVFLPSAPRPAIAQWLSELAQVPDFWNRVQRVTQEERGDMVLQLAAGANVVWGHPDIAGAREKARTLQWVLDDAHHRLGGTSAADLRFFDEGRIVIRPKGT